MADGQRVDDLGPLTDYDESGVDVTLIRSMLSRSPAERLGITQAYANFILSVRELNDPSRLSKNST
jgi:hypothetical protein